MNLSLGLLIPFIGTTLGALMVYFVKDKINDKIEKLLLGFASGVMIAASMFSLIIPSLNMAKQQGRIEWLDASVGFMLGILFLLILDVIIPHIHIQSNTQEGLKSKLKNTTKMFLAVTLHNIPEGLAVGVAFAATLSTTSNISLASALALSIGIALQNLPEGAIISLPLKAKGMSKTKAFVYGMLSGIVEPIAACFALVLTSIVTRFLPIFLSFAAGAMIYVVIEELIPESQTGKHTNIATIGVAIGFVIMMILDVSLG